MTGHGAFEPICSKGPSVAYGQASHWGIAMAGDQPVDAAERPKLFRNMTAWIGGATAVLVALGGLAGAYRNLFSDAAPQTKAATNAQGLSQPAPASQTARVPTSYTTDDGGTFRLVDGMWVWTTKEGDKYRYSQLSNDGVNSVAVLKGEGENGKDVYVRWPNAGGQALQSFDDQANWTAQVNFTPAT